MTTLQDFLINEGRNDFLAGRDQSHCPYRTGIKRESWLKGWYTAKDCGDAAAGKAGRQPANHAGERAKT